MAGILNYEPKYESDEEDEIINELNIDDEIDGAGGLTLNGEYYVLLINSNPTHFSDLFFRYCC